ncbi:hypothetical protein BTN49_0005 [Candidatus Enterovibrio escicola]|uniref:Mobile element protein n=1 Tax=Candidatus Enterovibrio escicola TaxID=1927127 RepID=A0A2A5T7Y1_9GAMM|nr:hypothetical protein BTN49_0005 [Candidatus Enterovibrio escacola]
MFIPKLTLRNYNDKVGTVLVNMKAMNQVIGLGMPIHQQIN